MEEKEIKRAVVLGGGGSKGAYQIGVWQAFLETGLEYHVVTGTSVGALNGALMAQREFQSAYDMWWNMDNSLVLSNIPSLGDAPDSLLGVYRAFVHEMVKNGGLDITPLENTIRGILDEDKLRTSGIDYGIVTVDMKTLKPSQLFLEDMPRGQVMDYMIASASCFPAFHPKEIESVRFIDGGYYDTVPVEMATRSRTPVDEIYSIDIDGVGIRRSFRAKVPVHTIRSYWDLGNFLIFEKEQSRRNILLGYYDAMKEFGRYEGRAYIFPVGETARLEAACLPRMSAVIERIMSTLSSGTRQKLEKLVRARLAGAIAGGRKKKMTQGELLLASAETAGELLELNPVLEYTLEEFNTRLLERLRVRTDQRGDREITLEELKDLSATRLGEGLRSLKREFILLSVLENLNQLLDGGEPLIRPELLAALAPREFVGCLYLLVLARENQEDTE